MSRLGTIFGASATALALVATLGVSGASAGDGEDCPPNPEPGKCYEKVFTPAYEVYTGSGYSQARPASFAWREVPCGKGGRSYSAASSSSSRTSSSPDLIRAVQSALTVEGYYSGPITGETNAGTERGLAAFQADRGLAAGWTPQTLRALGVPN